MTTVDPYVVAGSEYSRDESREEAVLTFTVSGMAGNPASRPVDAAASSGIPRWNAPHPTKPNLRVVSYRSTPVAGQPGTFNVVVRYRVPTSSAGDVAGDATISVSTQSISEETVHDINGNLMVLQYISRIVTGIGGSSVSRTTQVHRIQVQRPTFAVSFSRRETVNAFATALRFSGRVNLRTWQGQPRASWLMNVSSSDNGDGTHRFTYTAVHNPKTWRAEIRVSVNGRLPDTATVGNGIEFRDVYELADFSQLALPRVI